MIEANSVAPALTQTRLCFLIAASPTDGFRGQIAMFRRSLDALGGIYERARVVVVFGETVVEEIPERWRPSFDRITVVHVDPAEFRSRGYAAQGDAVWANVPADCDLAILCDADTIVVRPLDELLDRLLDYPGIGGAIAHYPFPQFPGDTPGTKWAALGRVYIGRGLPMTYQHSLWQATDLESNRYCPFYVNHGFVIVARQHVESIGESYRALSPRVAMELTNPYFGGQVALTLAVYAQGVPHYAFDIKYNFPNDPLAEELYPASLSDVRVIHYLRTERVDRQKVFATRESFEGFLRLPLTGVERVFQEHILHITQGNYPF